MTLEGKALGSSYRVQGGERLYFDFPTQESPGDDAIKPLPGELTILFEDSDLMVVSKPKGQVVIPGVE